MYEKKIVVSFYNRRNFGDDLFLSVLYNQIRSYDVKIQIIRSRNPFAGIPKEIKGKIHYDFFSYFWAFPLLFEQRVLKKEGKTIISKLFDCHCHYLEEKSTACVRIGGSLFMDYPDASNKYEIDFSAPKNSIVDYSIVGVPNWSSNRFLIGVNFGPVYHTDYWDYLTEELNSYNFAAIRDYSSFLAVKNLNNVQYAPDVGFMSKKIYTKEDRNLLVISVVGKVEGKVCNADIINKYYQLLADASEYWIRQGGKVVLLSLCKKEGDDYASDKVLDLLNDELKTSVRKKSYCGNLTEIQTLIASAGYVIASRFHCMIISLVNDKMVYPISYNCKTEHYLIDISFQGTYLTLRNLMNTTVDDVFSNYHNKYLCDISQHIRYSENQFYGLKTYLNHQFRFDNDNNMNMKN